MGLESTAMQQHAIEEPLRESGFSGYRAAN